MFCDCHQLALSAAGAFALERGTIAGYLLLAHLFLVFSRRRSIHTVALEDPEDLVTCRRKNVSNLFSRPEIPDTPKHTGHNLDLGNAVRVTENDTDLRGGHALLGELADLVDDLLRGGLEPRRDGARVGDGGG